ncbi:MAG TPA: MFS transporter [Burkholderiaceae bacterium]
MSTATNPALAPSRLFSASVALRSQFFVSGALFASWGVHVPTVKLHYGLGEQSLAIAMLAAGVGALAALAQAGRVVGRHGPRLVSLITGLLCCLSISGLIAFESYAALLLLMLGFGACASLFDVSINAEASEIERLAGRPLMSGFHGMFSLGGMVGAGLGSFAITLGLSTQQHLLLAAGICAPLIVIASAAMLKMDTPAPGEKQPLSLPRGPLLLIGVLAAMGLITEGAMYDWSVLFMKQDRGSDASMAAMAYASFSAAMAAGRFGGDWIRGHVSPVALMRGSGALAALGMALALFVPSPMVALVAFGLVGLGLSNVVPVLFSAASQIPGVSPAHGIAAVSSLGYLGMMAGPPLIGMLAQASSLTFGLLVVVVFAIVMAVSAGRALKA